METIDEIDERIDKIQNINQLKDEMKLMWKFIRAGIVAEPKKR